MRRSRINAPWYVSDGDGEAIAAKTMHEMAEDADQRGWKFTFSEDRTTVTVDWGNDVVAIYQLRKDWR